MFIIAHPLSSMDKLEDNGYIKTAENLLSFKRLDFMCVHPEVDLYRCEVLSNPRDAP